MSKANRLVRLVIEKGYTIDRQGIVYNSQGAVKTLNQDKRGYKRFSYRIDGQPRNVYVHKLQAYSKYGEDAFNCEAIRHLDGNPSNNSYDNILLGSQSDNMMDRPEVERIRIATMASRKANPREESERFEIYEAIYQGESLTSISNRLNISKGTLSYMKNKSNEYKLYINTLRAD